jgi:acyl-CoA thioesterase FadM
MHSKMSYRSPAFTGDVTFIDGEVEEISEERLTGQPIAHLKVVMTNQRNEVMASGTAEVRLPTETRPER